MQKQQIRIAIGSDHAGYVYKQQLLEYLLAEGYEVKDFGPHSADSVDYPDFAHPLADAVEKKAYNFGFLLCGSANGVAITANKHQHIRAAIAWKNEIAQLARLHNDANILCLPARFISVEEAKQFAHTFLHTAFEGGRHAGRVNKIACP